MSGSKQTAGGQAYGATRAKFRVLSWQLMDQKVESDNYRDPGWSLTRCGKDEANQSNPMKTVADLVSCFGDASAVARERPSGKRLRERTTSLLLFVGEIRKCFLASKRQESAWQRAPQRAA
jgi:hypothetical protein